MTQNKNKHFNTYKEGLDLEFLRAYCMEHGERRTFLRGETLEDIASFLNITPSYLSTLRKEMTYETRAEGKRACTMLRKKE